MVDLIDFKHFCMLIKYRYKEALAKMENEWKSATSTLNTTSNLEKIKELSEQLEQTNIKLVSLKEENQSMKDRLHPKKYNKPETNNPELIETRNQSDSNSYP